MNATKNTPAAAVEPVACRRCKRALTSLASRLAGIGPRCAAIETATQGLSAKQLDKMTQVIIDGGVTATAHKGAYRVVSEDGGTVHLCHLNGNCNCEWGLRRKSADTKVCYAVAAARLTARPQIRCTIRQTQFAKVA